jgi:cytochrome b561
MPQLKEKYSLEMRVLHWLMAVAFFGMLIVGFTVSGIPKNEPTRHLYLGLHKSFGITLFALAALRLALRLSARGPSLPDSIPSMQRAIAHAAHFAFYTLMFLMPMSGYVMSISMGQPVRWFGLALPRLLVEDRARGLIAGNVHAVAAFVLVALLVLHLGAVAWHYFIGRLNLLQRIA